jgi:hypothetical protein
VTEPGNADVRIDGKLRGKAPLAAQILTAAIVTLVTAALGLVSIGCSSNDACDGLGTCLAVTAMPAPGNPPINVDQLTVTVAGQVSATRNVPAMPTPVSLPLTVALEFNPPSTFTGQLTFTVTIVGKKAGVVVANGQAPVTMTTGKHQLLTVQMMSGALSPGSDMTNDAMPSDMSNGG